MRYYIHATGSHCYDHTGLTCPERLPLDLEALVRAAGGTRLRWARKFGWCNQDRVLTFNADNPRPIDKMLTATLQRLQDGFPWGLMVCEHWRQPKSKEAA